LRTRTAGGVVATTELVYGPGCGYVVGMEVVGRRGTVATPAEPAPAGGPDDWRGRFDEAYRRQLSAWTSAAARGAVDVRGAGAQDGLAVTQVLAAADRSWRAGGPVRPAR
jgi:myo-inositol 2-dehydrogenase / D-chiro-inositol 1-dehydrogenase